MPFRIFVSPFHCTHLFFPGTAFLNHVTLRCNPYIKCITRSTGCFGIMHTVVCFCPINKQCLFWCGIVHWFRTISCLCRHEITIFKYISVYWNYTCYPKLNVEWCHGFGKGIAKNFRVIVHCACSHGMVRHPVLTPTVIILLNKPYTT